MVGGGLRDGCLAVYVQDRMTLKGFSDEDETRREIAEKNSGV